MKEPARQLVVCEETFSQGWLLALHQGDVEPLLLKQPFKKIRDLPDGSILVENPEYTVWLAQNKDRPPCPTK